MTDRIALTLLPHDLKDPLFSAVVEEWKANRGCYDSQRPVKEYLRLGKAISTLKLDPIFLRAYETGALERISNSPEKMRYLLDLLMEMPFVSAPVPPESSGIKKQAHQVSRESISNKTCTSNPAHEPADISGMRTQITS